MDIVDTFRSDPDSPSLSVPICMLSTLRSFKKLLLVTSTTSTALLIALPRAITLTVSALCREVTTAVTYARMGLEPTYIFSSPDIPVHYLHILFVLLKIYEPLLTVKGKHVPES